MADKIEVKSILPRFCKTIQNQFQTTIKNVRNDNGRKFISLKYLFLENGITHQTRIKYIAQQNGRLERKITTFSMSLVLFFFNPIFLSLFGEIVF